jgi:hypothetical protein
MMGALRGAPRLARAVGPEIGEPREHLASESVQDYLKTIYKLSRDQESVSTSAIAARLDVRRHR